MPLTLIRLTALFILLILMAVLWRYLASTGLLTLEKMKGLIVQLEAVWSSPYVVTLSCSQL